MKWYVVLLFLFLSVSAFAADSDSVKNNKLENVCNHKPTALWVGLGFVDYYRTNSFYKLPDGFSFNNISGFRPINTKIEYGLKGNMCLNFSFFYNNFIYNLNKHTYSSAGTDISRSVHNKFSLFGGGFGFQYYLNKYVHINFIEPFINAQINICTIYQSAFPISDSTIAKTDHVGNISIKIGAIHYFNSSKSAGIYADVGYDKQSMVNLGLFCAFKRLKGKHLRL